MKTISELLPELMREIGDIGKNRRNSHQNYQFRGIDDVLNHVGPSCAKLGVRVQVTVHDYANDLHRWAEGGKEKFSNHVRLRMRLEFCAPDGTSHVAEAIGEGIDTQGDKATNKAMSAAFKYACFMGLVIPVEGALDDSDTDGKQPEREATKGNARAAKKEAPAEPGITPDQSTEIRDLFGALNIEDDKREKQIQWASKGLKDALHLLTEAEADKLLKALHDKKKALELSHA